MRRTYRYKGWMTALSVIGMAAIVIPTIGAQASTQRDNVKWAAAAADFRGMSPISALCHLYVLSTVGGRRNGRLSINVWQKPFITKRAQNRGPANSLSQMSSKIV